MNRENWQYSDDSPESPGIFRIHKYNRKRNPFRSRGLSLLTIFTAMVGITMIYRRRESIHESILTSQQSSAHSLNNRTSGAIDVTPDVSKTETSIIKKAKVEPSPPPTSGTEPVSPPQSRRFDRTGVPEHFTTIRNDWREVVTNFLDTSPIELFSARKIRDEYAANSNNIQDTCMLVTIMNGNVTFLEGYERKRHGRASSVKYILRKIVKEKGRSLPGITFLVMLTDGHKPRIPTLGSARHWNDWKMMIPVPLGNERGVKEDWGTPLENWDAYINRTIISTHDSYPWESKKSQALFRGSFTMQTYKLGTCNEENDGKCERASKWNEVNRGMLYEITKENNELFDVGFTKLRGKHELPSSQFDGVPDVVPNVPFQDFQKYKIILSVGSNQDWAERLRSLMFMNSAVVIHSAETQEFFTPLMKEWVHYIPTELNFEDLEKNVEWALAHEDSTKQIIRNQNTFAGRYFTERSMQQYWEVLLEEFSVLQARAAAGGISTSES